MPHATSGTDSTAATAETDKIGHHLTESILTLRRTIQSIREDVVNGIAPSILMPADSTHDVETGMIMLSLEPSTVDIDSHLAPLESRLQDLEHTTRSHAQWFPPAVPPKLPEYSIIDISDLSSAIRMLEDISKHTSPAKPISPQPSFAQYEWTWDPLWKEFYTLISDRTSYVYLSRWKYNEQRQVWEHVSLNGADLMPDVAAEMFGSWEDWTWDPIWKEWYLDVSHETEDESRCCVYASRWEVRESGEWVYTGRFGA